MKHFGTDGVRGRAGTFPLDPHGVRVLGRAMGKASKGPVVVGRDTRESGAWIFSALREGVEASGRRVIDLGICPTPFVARITARLGKGLGAVVSASHNPWVDNGIKVLAPDGRKASEALEQTLECALSMDGHEDVETRGGGGRSPWRSGASSQARHGQPPTGPRGMRPSCAKSVTDDLKRILKSFKSLKLKGLPVALDCAHGAASELGPMALKSLGARMRAVGVKPDGRNINRNCGSLHLSLLKRTVRAGRCRLGFAFDGDADRCLVLDAKGVLHDGDEILALLAARARTKGERGSRIAVGTVMSNQGLEDWLASRGIKLLRTSVGDKYVVEALHRYKAPVGAEASGHVAIRRFGYVGDGIVTMLAVLEALQPHGFDFAKALPGFRRYPQVLINIKVKEKRDFKSVPGVASAAQEAEVNLRGKGRLLLRYSGTENLARVMVEASTPRLMRSEASRVAEAVKLALG
ncbi:MAG: phosphoglucosamine mutase [Planctomycetota bacterium]